MVFLILIMGVNVMKEYDLIEQFELDEKNLPNNTLVFIRESKKILSKIDDEWVEFFVEEVSCGAKV